jgi:hypothetical protein
VMLRASERSRTVRIMGRKIGFPRQPPDGDATPA